MVGVNIGAGKDSEDRIGDYVLASPHEPGRRLPHHQHLVAQHARLARSASTGSARRLLARVQEARGAAGSARRSWSSSRPTSPIPIFPAIVRVIQAHGVDGIVVSNTTLSREGLKDRGFAAETGMSGRPLFARATRMLARVYKLTEGS